MEEKILQKNCPISPMVCFAIYYILCIGAGMFIVAIFAEKMDGFDEFITSRFESCFTNYFSKKKLIQYSAVILPKWVGFLVCNICEMCLLLCLLVASKKLPKPQTKLLSVLILLIAIYTLSYFFEYDGGLHELSGIASLLVYMIIGIRMIIYYHGKLQLMGIAFLLCPIVYAVFSFINNYYINFDNDWWFLTYLIQFLAIPILYDVIRRIMSPKKENQTEKNDKREFNPLWKWRDK